MKKMDYVDLFALPLPKKNMARYIRSARLFARVIKDCGARDYRGFVGDDLHAKGMTPFTRDIKLRGGEVLVCAYVLYDSRAARDRASKKMMADPRMEKEMQAMSKNPPFDFKRMLYGGFQTIVQG